MLPEFTLKKVKLKVSTDSVSLISGYIVFAVVVSWYVMTRGWQHANPIGFYIIAGLVLLQFAALWIPQTRTKEIFNSGGIFPLLVYNIAMTIVLIWYAPLYSPFILIMQGIIFVSVYYRGLITAILTGLEIILITVVGTALQGLPKEPFSYLYPYAIIILGISYVASVSRAGRIEDGVRLELGRVATQVSKERQQLGTLINSIADAVIAVDTAGNILFYNAGALNILNNQSIKIGQPFNSIIKLYDDKGTWVDPTSLVTKKTGQTRFNNLHILPTDDEHTDLSIDVSRIAPDPTTRQASGFIYLMRDITKQKSLDEERDEFISVTSHELRTPISMVEANISLALLDQKGKPTLPGETKDRLEKAHQSIVYLANLTNQLITLSEAEKNQLEIISAPLDIKELLDELSTKYSVQAQAKGLRFVTKMAPQVTTVNTSRIYLGEILENFLTNALKYTDKGSITLATTLSPNHKNLILSVEDTGVGISVSDKAKVFEKFYRSEDFHTRETGGTGLGLYMCRQLATYLNAKLDFESKLGKGSIFRITLKL